MDAIEKIRPEMVTMNEARSAGCRQAAYRTRREAARQ
jgi:hypothetical protein